MAITFSQRDYWDLVQVSQAPSKVSARDAFESVLPLSPKKGKGYHYSVQLREDVALKISHFQLHSDQKYIESERLHPVEYSFFLSGKFFLADKGIHSSEIAAGQYFLSGSGTAPAKVGREFADEPILEVNVHIKPLALKTFFEDALAPSDEGLAHLIQPDEQLCHRGLGITTVAMQTALHQMIHCPFNGVTKKVYLESKVWELMALLLDQERQRQDQPQSSNSLKPDDIERIHYAKAILAQQLDNPPALLDLARRVGLNDCTLKQGFRQVFGETAFGYLHSLRMETARQLLLEGEVNVTEAARRVGFVNRGHFAASFRKKYGVSPREYLRQRKG